MKKNMYLALAIVMGVGFLASGALADDDDKKWTKLESLTAAGGAKEIKKSGKASFVRFKCTEGKVIIDTLVVRNGGKKTFVKVVSTIEKDKVKDVGIGDKVDYTGFRVSIRGGGKCDVYVKE